MKKYWLYLKENTFIWSKNRNILIYNSDNYKSFKYLSNNELLSVVDSLCDIKNLYCVSINQIDLDNSYLEEFIKGIEDIDAGGILEINNNALKPITFFPILNLQPKIAYEKGDINSLGQYLYTYLHEVTVYLNGYSAVDCDYCKQIIYPPHTDKSLNIDLLEQFLLECSKTYFQRINIAGNELLSLKGIENLIQFVNKFKRKIYIYLTIDDLYLNKDKIKILNMNNINVVLLCKMNEVKRIELIIPLLEYINQSHLIYSFIVTSNEDLESIDYILSKFEITNYNIKPVYNGNNESFFDEFVYLDKNDLDMISLSKKDIFSHQSLNTFSFGKLTIMPDGNIYANVNSHNIGCLTDSVRDVLMTEMVQNTSWRLIRNNPICTNCVYQWLCPSPSNYERVMKKSTICHIR